MKYTLEGAYRASIFTTILVVILDIYTKNFWFAQKDPWTKLAPFLQTIQHRNQGLIFNLPLPIPLIIALSILALSGAILFLRKKIPHDPRFAAVASLLTAGAIGNLYDRIALGFVRDWILAFNKSAFNIADISIALGLILFVILNQERTEKSQEI